MMINDSSQVTHNKGLIEVYFHPRIKFNRGPKYIALYQYK
jgi:hypothetical protein